MKRMEPIFNNPRTPLWVALAALVLLLAACGTNITPETITDDRFDLITSVTIDETVTRAELEAYSGGSIIVFRPEAGFAIVAFQKGQGDLALLKRSHPNQDMFETPEMEAGGWTAWSGGWTAWSGGWTAWSGGWTAWSGGEETAFSTFGENLAIWDHINLPEAHLLAPNLGGGVKIAVIDTGVDVTHPAFDGKLAPSSEWYDFVDDDTLPMDEAGGNGYGHGTGVAGVILQVAPNVTILPIRALNADGTGDVDDVVAAIDHAITMGADIINMSLGTTDDIDSLRAMMIYAANQDVMSSSSGGNADTSSITYPAAYARTYNAGGRGAMAVGSIDLNDVKSVFSNYDSDLEVMAPGENVYTLAPDGQITFWSGTSFAAPMGAGALALAIGEPGISGNQVSTLKNAAYDIDHLNNPAYANRLGEGRMDIEHFLQLKGL